MNIISMNPIQDYRFAYNEEFQLIKIGNSIFNIEGELIVNDGVILSEGIVGGLLSFFSKAGNSDAVKAISKTAKVGAGAVGAVGSGAAFTRDVDNVEERIDQIEDILSWASLIPFVGNFAMGLNVALYAYELFRYESGSEDHTKAKIALAGSIIGVAFPYAGKIFQNIRKAGKGLELFFKNKKVIEMLAKVSKNIGPWIAEMKGKIISLIKSLQASDVGKKLFTGDFKLNVIIDKINDTFTYLSKIITRNFSGAKKIAKKGAIAGAEKSYGAAKAAFEKVSDPKLVQRALEFSKTLKPESWFKPNYATLRKILETKKNTKIMAYMGKKTAGEKAYPVTQRNLDIFRKRGMIIRLAPVPMDIYEKLTWVGAGLVVAAGIFNRFSADEKAVYAFYAEEDQEVTTALEQAAPKGEEQAPEETGAQTGDQAPQAEPAQEENPDFQFSYIATDGQRRQAAGTPAEHTELGVHDKLDGAKYYKKSSQDGPEVFAVKDNKIYYYRNGEWVAYRSAKII